MQATWLILSYLSLNQGATDLDLNQILGKVRQATHFQAFNDHYQMRISGEAHETGLVAKLTFQFDGKGRWFTKTESELGAAQGFDGKNYWVTTRCGYSQSLCFDSKDKNRILQMLLTNQWLKPKSEAAVSLAQDQNQPDGYLLSLKLKDTGKEVKLVVSKTTYLPVRSIRQESTGESITTFDQWTDFGGYLLPTNIRAEQAGVSSSYRFIGKSAQPFNADDFKKPTVVPADTTFDLSKPSKVEAKRILSGHMMVHPLINGKDVGWFFLDSGAEVMVIDKEVADELKLEAVGKTVVGGIGGVGTSQFRRVDEFELGPMKIKGQRFLEIDLKAIANALNMKIAGIVGHDAFYRSIIESDNPKNEVYVYEPSQYKLKEGKWIKMLIDSGLPSIETSFEGGKGWFGMDTGSEAYVLFNSPAVKRLNLLEGRKTTPTKFGGYGGYSDGKAGTLGWFELSGQRITNLRAGFSLAEKGALANDYLVGSIGQQMIKSFRVVFDFANERVAFIKATP